MFYFKGNNMARKFVHIDVYTKELNSVVGKAFECIQVRKYKKFTENILLNRFEIEWQENLTDLDCKKMVKYKLCGKSRGKMNCDNKSVALQRVLHQNIVGDNLLLRQEMPVYSVKKKK